MRIALVQLWIMEINLSKLEDESPERITPACPITRDSLNVGISTVLENIFLNIALFIKKVSDCRNSIIDV